MRNLKDYPIDKCLETVKNPDQIRVPQDLGRLSGAPYAQLMIIIGATVFNGTGDTKYKLAGIVQSCISRAPTIVDHWKTLPPSPLHSNHDADGRYRMPTVQEPRFHASPPIHTYTSKLHEWAVQKRVMLNWDARMLSEFNDWEHSVSFQGKEFKAEAQLKQDAKHLACKKACEHLGI